MPSTKVSLLFANCNSDHVKVMIAIPMLSCDKKIFILLFFISHSSALFYRPKVFIARSIRKFNLLSSF